MVSKLGLWVCVFLCARVAKLKFELLNNAGAIISKRSGEELPTEDKLLSIAYCSYTQFLLTSSHFSFYSQNYWMY